MNFIFLGTTNNYPFSFSANNTKTELLARGLFELGHNVSIISGILGEKEETDIKTGKTAYGFNYVLLPRYKSTYQTIKNNTSFISNFLKEHYKMGEKNIIILEFSICLIFFLNLIICRKRNYRVIHILTEWPLSFKLSKLKHCDAYLYLNVFGWFVDGILPISNALANKVKKFHKPLLKIPILADYTTQYNSISNFCKPYFVFCASARYVRLLEFIIESYKIYNKDYSDILYLVLYGSDNDIERIKQIIFNNNLSNNIIIKCKLSSNELQELYRNAQALLIPLNPSNNQDKYRFSQKIAEYLSSSTPIVTTPVGEVANYFNKDNAYLIDEFTPNAYANAMKYISSHKSESIVKGNNGYNLGVKEFNYKIYGLKLSEFVKSI